MATITKNRALEESGSRKRKRLGERESSISSQDELESDHLLTATEVDSLETSNYKPTDNLRPARKPKSVLSADKVSRSLTGVKNTGVIYISRIPPRLTPPKLRELLSPYGSKVLRIFLAPETTAEYTRRIKSGGSKMRQFKEGWVEFEDKKVAKNVVGILNAQRIGTKKGDFWYDDLWCLKYLPKFKWHHLTEQIAFQNASRAEKLRNEVAQEKRENQAFVKNSERSKMIQNIQQKRQKKAEKQSDVSRDTKPQRQFQQKPVVLAGQKSRQAVLRKVFE